MITLNVKTMRRALSGFSKITLRTLKNPTLQSVRFTAKGGTLHLSVTDLDQTLQFTPEGTAHEDGDFLVPLEKLRSCCKNEKAGTRLHFHPERDRILIHIDDGSITSEISCDLLPIKDYPDPPRTKGQSTEIPATGVRAIREATGSASDDPTREILNSVFLDSDNVVATNGRILYRSTGLNLDLVESLIIPCEKAISLLDGENPAVLQSSGNPKAREHTLVQDDWAWTFRRKDGTYPNYTQVLPKSDEDRIEIQLSDSDVELLERLARLPFADEREPFAGLCLEAGDLLLRIGRGSERQVFRLNPASIRGGVDTHVFFNYNFMMVGLKHGLRTLSMKDEIGSVLLLDDHRTQLFMPLRYEAQKGEWKVTQTSPGAAATPASVAKAPVPKEPAKQAACAVSSPAKTAPSPEASSVRNEGSEDADAIAVLIEEATRLRDSLKEDLSGLSHLLKTARRASREQTDLEREHRGLKRSIRTLQRIEV